MVAAGAGAELHVCPASVVRAIARHEPEGHGTVPAVHPSDAETKVTDRGANPAGTAGGAATVVVTGKVAAGCGPVVGGGTATTTEAAVEEVGRVDRVVEVAEEVEVVAVVVVVEMGATTPIRDDPPPGQ
jgi:hypothetical protein